MGVELEEEVVKCDECTVFCLLEAVECVFGQGIFITVMGQMVVNNTL